MDKLRMTSILCMFVAMLIFSINPAFANCSDSSQNADLDEQCNTGTCSGSKDEVKGCYLPPEPGLACPAEYPNKTGDICCCAG